MILDSVRAHLCSHFGTEPDTASVTLRPSSVSRSMAGTRPTVDSVIERCEMPRPDGAGSTIRCTAAITRL